MTCKDTFLTREEYNQIIYAAFGQSQIKRIRTLKPAIYKPQMLWTGKQVVTTILKNFDISVDDEIQAGMNLTSKSKVKEDNWGPLGAGESEVIVMNNELLQGVLDKSPMVYRA